MKLSLIICIYNTERHYFEECLSSVFLSMRSVVSEKIQGVDFEVCVVDDGSDEDYSDILARYKVRYVKTANQGIFKARLRGIDMASGDYIAFVDSDDIVSLNYHASMLCAARALELDIVINGWAFKSKRAAYYCRRDSTIYGNIDIDAPDSLELFFSKEGREHSYYVLWNKLYRASVIKTAAKQIESIGIRDKYNYSEDVLLNFYAFSLSRRVKNICAGYYFYRIHSSQSVSVISSERLKGHIECMSMTFGIMKRELLSRGRGSLILNLEAWRELMSRTHYSYAWAKRYYGLYDLIKKVYGIEKLKKNRPSDSTSYRSTALLPENRSEIDTAFARLCESSNRMKVSYRRGEPYICSCIRGLELVGFVVEYARDGERIPKPQNSILNRILHNRIIYTVGTFVFRKGSKIRSCFKRLF